MLIQGAVTNPNFTTPSFTATASGPNMVGGSNSSGTTIYDAGTARIAIGSLTPASIAWTSADTAATIATRLAAAVTTADGTTVTATASGSQILLKGVTAGTAANIGLQTSTTYNTAYFSAPSVTLSGATGLTGGANAIPAQSAGPIYQYSSGAWAGNGNLQSMTDSILGTQSFTYDHLNRLTQAAFSGGKGNFTMAWGYDTYGNRKSESVSGTSSLSFTQPSPSSYLGASVQNGTPLTGAYNNRVDGQNYDLSGNFLGSQFTAAFTYDAASRIETAGSVCYLYNAEGLRTAKGTWSEGECLNITAQYVLGAGDAQLAEFDGAGNWKHTNVFGGGKLLATYDALGTHFHLNDWLGTARLQVGVSGAIDETCISLPFGDGLTCSGPGSDATEHHFTGKEHDAETGLDYFGARYFQSTAGRWMSPDWAAKTEPIPYAKMDNPQSLDLYAYVENNPLSVADADGHDMPTSCPDVGMCGVGAQSYASQQIAKIISGYNPAVVQMEQNMLRAFAVGLSLGVAQQSGRQPDGSYKAPTGPGSEIYNRTHGGKNDPIGPNGECVDACRHFSGAPASSSWTPGRPVTGLNDTTDVGLAIASFGPNGRYAQPGGDQNSAIYMGHDPKTGQIMVVDQWPPPNAKQYNAPFEHPLLNHGEGHNLQTNRMENNAYYYHVIVVP